MTIDPKWQNFKCWACGKQGDVFTFVMEMEKVDFLAPEKCCARANISLEGEAGPNPERLSMLDAMRGPKGSTASAFTNCPCADARHYVWTSANSMTTRSTFGLGFAPFSGDWLRPGWQDGQSWETLREIGLLWEREEGKGFYDRFRDRVCSRYAMCADKPLDSADVFYPLHLTQPAVPSIIIHQTLRCSTRVSCSMAWTWPAMRDRRRLPRGRRRLHRCDDGPSARGRPMWWQRWEPPSAPATYTNFAVMCRALFWFTTPMRAEDGC